VEIHTYDVQVRDYVRQRCREHLERQEKLLGRPITFDYRFEHTRTAVGIAENLASHLGIDPVLARIAAWLHDIAKCWDPHLDEDANLARENNHGPAGGEEAGQYLRSLGFAEELTRQVEQAITVHEGYIKDYILDEPLDALLWDADKLSKINGAGMFHYLGVLLTTQEEVIDLHNFFSDPDREYLHQGIRNSLNTEIARKLADQGIESAAQLRRQLLKALEGKQF